MKNFSQFLNEEYQFKIRHNELNKNVEFKYSPETKDELIQAIETEIEEQGPEADLNCIDTSKMVDMSNLFDPRNNSYTKKFNGDISNWDVSNVKNMASMFFGAGWFNCDISNWNTQKVRSMNNMFNGAMSFNQDISKWNVDNVNYHDTVFIGCPIEEEYKPNFK